MPDEIRVNENDSIIEIISSGTLTKQDMENTKTEIQQINAEKAINNVLIDTTRIESAPSSINIFDAIVTQPQGFKIAILVTPSSPITEDMYFAENAGINRGIIIKVFTDENESRRWLGNFKG
jgi:hypothetical protein